MITPAALLKDLKRLVRTLEDDIRDGLPGSEADARLQREWQAAKDAGRSAATYESWREEEITQSAVHWVLGGVFLRFIEDNGLVERPWLAGPTPERRTLARDGYEGYFRAHPHESDRDYLLACFTEAGKSHGAAALFDARHNPVWELPVSGDGGIALMNFWTKADPDSGRLVHDFSDPELSTRFLGDLYQDLSEAARKRYALLQTPEFVEEFILDRTLSPAIQEFGFREVRLIDPTCGSGHFLLGAFHRLVREWSRAEPGRNIRDVAQRALDAVAGVDINPFAIAVARFRLLVAALKVCGIARLADAPDFRFELAAGDSLLHGQRFAEVEGVQLSFDHGDGVTHVYHTEDRDDLDRILGRQYHAVVGNPPYIQVKDKALNEAYRQRYSTCHRAYSLGVPFTQRFFNLALPPSPSPLRGSPPSPARGEGSLAGAGFVGLITANSFMKREFGLKLIEIYLPKRDLTHVIDTAGAYIPGHGTPTVILFGRNRPPVGAVVRAVMGINGEPATPADPAQGLVWTAILEQIDRAGSQSEFVSVEDMPRASLTKHPWSMGGGGATDLKELIANDRPVLESKVTEIGFGAVTREDDAYLLSPGLGKRMGISNRHLRPLAEGEVVRDYRIDDPTEAIWPYDSDTLSAEGTPPVLRHLWKFRNRLKSRVAYGKDQLQRGLAWFEYSMFFTDRYRRGRAISFAFVSTSNQFIFDNAGTVFNRTAPIVVLPQEAGDDEHLCLLGLLNSSAGGFWMKQTFHNKGSTVDDKGARQRTAPFEDFYEFTATGLQSFPLAEPYPLDLARELDSLAQQLSATLPAALFTPSPQPLSHEGRGASGLPSPLAGEGGDPRRGEGEGAVESGEDGQHHAFRIGQDVVVPQPQNPEPVRTEPGIADGIGGAVGMLPAIGLDHQSSGKADEIHDVGAERLLTAELEIRQLACSQDAPQRLFGIGGVAAKAAGVVGEHDAQNSTPSPLAGATDGSLRIAPSPSPLRGSPPSPARGEGIPTRAELDAARDRALSIRRRMIAVQEELDWRCYKLYGVVDDREGPEFGLEAPEIDLGQRAFEIVMARRMAAEELETTWFARHGSTPVTDIPDHWPKPYRDVVERRIALIESHRTIGLVEKPEYKRRWQWSDQGFDAGWVVRERGALERWLLDRLEDGRYWQGDPALKSVNALADLARSDADFCRAAALFEGQDDPDLGPLVARLVAGNAVPFLPALRYSEPGRRKRAQWERVWDLQRREDAGEDVGTIDVPPKYKREDFLGADYWRLRGGLDVPKERFISYPGAEKSADGGLTIAWAGFDHLAQARALAGFYHEMKDVEGWDTPRLIPLLAGLADLIPWLKQWHNAYDADFGQGPGDWFAAFLGEEMRALGVTAEDVAGWEPAAKVRVKRKVRQKDDEPAGA